MQIVTLTYPIADFVSIFALVTISLRRADPRHLPALRLVGLGILINTVANPGYASMLFAGTYQTGLWPSAGWILAFAVIGLAGSLQVRHSSSASSSPPTSPPSWPTAPVCAR